MHREVENSGKRGLRDGCQESIGRGEDDPRQVLDDDSRKYSKIWERWKGVVSSVNRRLYMRVVLFLQNPWLNLMIIR